MIITTHFPLFPLFLVHKQVHNHNGNHPPPRHRQKCLSRWKIVVKYKTPDNEMIFNVSNFLFLFQENTKLVEKLYGSAYAPGIMGKQTVFPV